MDTTILLSLIGLAGTAVGWYGKVLLAATKKPVAWNGTERRTKELIEAQVNIHTITCPAKRDFEDSLKELRKEIKADILQFRDELRTELHHLHEEIRKERT